MKKNILLFIALVLLGSCAKRANEEVSSYDTVPVTADSTLGDSQYKINIVYGTDRKRIGSTQYSEKRREKEGFDMGALIVSIPHGHKEGEIEKPAWWNVIANPEDTLRYVVVQSIDTSSVHAIEKLKSLVENSSEKDAFVFVHGFNTTFQQAAERTAQLAFDIGFKGCPAMFSWPSAGKVVDYVSDLQNAEVAVPDLKAFLEKIVTEAKPKKLHLIAHSMGNIVLTHALRDFTHDHPDVQFNQIILAAPDVDAQVFRRDIAPKIIHSAQRITMYCSSKDKALIASKKLRSNYRRAGETSDPILTVAGIETIDASGVAKGSYFSLDHSYFGDSNKAITDIFLLLDKNLGPDERNLLRIRKSSGDYWALRN